MLCAKELFGLVLKNTPFWHESINFSLFLLGKTQLMISRSLVEFRIYDKNITCDLLLEILDPKFTNPQNRTLSGIFNSC